MFAQVTTADGPAPNGVVLWPYVAGVIAAEPYVNGQWQLTAHLIIYFRNVAAVLRANEDVVVFDECTLASHISEFYDPINRHRTLANDLGLLSGSLTALAHGSAFAGGVTQ